MELLKLLSANEVFVQVINFLILLTILRIFFWKRILGLLDERKNRIASELKSIEDSKKEVEGLKAEIDSKLKNIDTIAKSRLKEAAADAEKLAEDITSKAHLDADRIINDAKKEVQYEVAKAKDELKDKIVDLTIATAENLIGEKLTEENDRKIVEKFLSQVDELK